MNRTTHILIGIITVIGYGFITSPFRITTDIWPTIGFFLAVLGAIIPDILEPPIHWTHRKFFHGWTIMKWTIGIFGITAVIGLFLSPIYGISCFFLGYISHLFADSTTYMGLPK
jgi:membrane-bound metal-dependent hydrolase YbcI (DUF457 family)